ncbi:MAG: permease-like cell division protein FtsX [Oscillospiraceae bacterium]|nr:permease-like cell division protein FtsX [Oscillospiraceae bacterium]
MSFASVAIIVACLVIMGSVSMIALNIDALIKDMETQNEVVAFVDEELDDAEAMAIEAAILQVPNVADAEFVNRQEAMDNFMSNYDEQLREGIDVEVFRHRYVLHLNDITKMAETKQGLENVPGVAKVNAHFDYAKAFISIRNIVSVISLILILVLVLVSIFIMTNTIKLATYGRREEIAIMKMVGAGNAFIRLPFIVEGLVLGLLGGGIAFLALWGLYELVTQKVLEVFTGSFLNVVPYTSVHVYVLGCFMAISVIVGVFGAVNAIRNYLKV